MLSSQVEAHRKHCLINGLDDIGLTLQAQERIRAFEARHRAAQPWLFRGRLIGTCYKCLIVKRKFLFFPGDGIGPEVVAQAVEVMRRAADAAGIDLSLSEGYWAACAIDATGSPLPAATLTAARSTPMRCCSAQSAVSGGTLCR